MDLGTRSYIENVLQTPVKTTSPEDNWKKLRTGMFVVRAMAREAAAAEDFLSAYETRQLNKGMGVCLSFSWVVLPVCGSLVVVLLLATRMVLTVFCSQDYFVFRALRRSYASCPDRLGNHTQADTSYRTDPPEGPPESSLAAFDGKSLRSTTATSYSPSVCNTRCRTAALGGRHRHFSNGKASSSTKNKK